VPPPGLAVAYAGQAQVARRPVRAAFSVLKPRIALEITLTAIAGAAVTAGPALAPWQLAVLAVSVFLSAGAAGAFNQLLERDLDARMARTRTRPFVTGELSGGRAWLAAAAALLAFATALAALLLNAMVALQVFLGAATYAFVYTGWLKRRTWLNIVVGGLAGSFAVLAGTAAIAPRLSSSGWILAAALFFWTPAHFWSLAYCYKRDYLAAGVPMLPNLMGDRPLAWIVLAHTMVLVGLTLLPPLTANGWFYTACAALGGAWFLGTSIAFVRTPTRAAAARNFHGSLWQLGLLLLGAIGSGVIGGRFGS
jgi:protoheme IX farnesyltransferase